MKTTKKHFDLFVKESQKWADKFQLSDWRLDFYHEKIDPNASADCRVYFYEKTATIRLNIEVGKTDTGTCLDTIKESAKHEMIHVLIGKLGFLGKERFIGAVEDIQAVEEELVRKLEKLLF